MQITADELRQARKTVGEVLTPTPAHCWPLLGERVGARVIVKHENHNPTGAFKVRGGIVYMDMLKRTQPDCPGVISATRGNHGQSIALAAAKAGIPVTIVVPQKNSREKNAAMAAFGARLIEHGEDFDDAKAHADALSAEQGLTFVPSFDKCLVSGVAGYGAELFEAHDDLDAVYVPIGLGSGICGTIAARDLLGAKAEIIGVQAEGSPAYARSFAAGHPVSTNTCKTFADGIATRIPDPQAVAMINAGASRIVTVSDEEIAAAIRHYWTDTHNLAEGAGAAPLAAALKEKHANEGKKIALILSGGNLDLDLFRERVFGAPPPDEA
ncbi:threonine dehydratase [Salaquimonas pukyongi]|uniref:threonine dehydratase n=1 Tax=Salaquimonas pukyongi TaxID=2712698 RepID=UPI00096B9A09|nr:threonine dehydratase [Salaquimonas pukyongi]